jgi:sterol desaturase/sphingolipid hydroxylase (fatty acid hydroxylase superfamily)
MCFVISVTNQRLLDLSSLSLSSSSSVRLFHRALHHRSIYHLVHKHHHKQKAPSRGNTDAINVHPFEFVSGEYLHLLCIWLVPCHVASAVTFVVAGGIFASLNHTRYDVSFLNSAM